MGLHEMRLCVNPGDAAISLDRGSIPPHATHLQKHAENPVALMTSKHIKRLRDELKDIRFQRNICRDWPGADICPFSNLHKAYRWHSRTAAVASRRLSRCASLGEENQTFRVSSFLLARNL